MKINRLYELQKNEPITSGGGFFSNLLLWLGVICIGCAWACLSGIYVSTYSLKTYESWFGYALAGAGILVLIICLRKIELKIASNYFWILVPLVLYGLLMPYPYSLGPWVLVSGLVLFYCGRGEPAVRRITPGILLSGLLLTIDSFVVPVWYYLGCHDRGLPYLASTIAGFFTFLGTTCSANAHTLIAKCMGDYRMIQVTADALGLLPGVLILVGIILCSSFKDNNSLKRTCFKILILWICYLLARYIVLVWIFLGWPDKTDISMMWNAVYCLLSFIPLAVILALFKNRIDLAGKLHLSWAALSRNVLVWMILVGCAIISAIFGSSLTDPGYKKAGRILLDEAHSEWEDTMKTFDTNWYGQSSTYNFYCLRKYLENYYKVTVNLDEITPGVLNNQDIAILKCPTRAYTGKELDALVSFVRGGGGLFLIGDHTDVFGTSTFLNPLAERFGHSFDKNGQWDIDGQFSIYKQPQTLGHPVGKYTPELLFATGCTLSAPVWAEKPFIGYGMMTRLVNYGNQNFFPDESHYEDRKFGLFLQVTGAFNGKGRILCFTDSTVWSNFSMFLQGKPELLLDSLMWLNRSNTWWARVKPYVLLLSLVLATAAMFVSPSCEVIKKHHCSIIAAFLTVILMSCHSVDRFHAWAYEQPKALRDFKKITFDCQHSDIFLANRLWFPETNNHEAPDYGAFFVSAQRLQIVPQVGHSLTRALEKNMDPVVFINPYREFSENEISVFHDYISKGGKALILDSSDRFSTSFAWQLIEPLSVEILYGQPGYDDSNQAGGYVTYVFSENKDYERSISFPTEHICEIKGGEPRLWYTPIENEGVDSKEWKPCLSEISLGKGKIWVCTLSNAFSGAGLGNSSTIPNAHQQDIYRLVFKILNDLSGK